MVLTLNAVLRSLNPVFVNVLSLSPLAILKTLVPGSGKLVANYSTLARGVTTRVAAATTLQRMEVVVVAYQSTTYC